jgi:hypothetical protein
VKADRSAPHPTFFLDDVGALGHWSIGALEHWSIGTWDLGLGTWGDAAGAMGDETWQIGT